MSKLILGFFLIASTSVIAHVKPGNYIGSDQSGNYCSFSVGEAYYEGNMHHPLTERVPVTKIFFSTRIDSEVWNLGHPPVVNFNEATVRFNHDIFQAIKPTKTGATSVTLFKGDEEKEEAKAPKGIIYLIDDYNDSRRNLICQIQSLK